MIKDQYFTIERQHDIIFGIQHCLDKTREKDACGFCPYHKRGAHEDSCRYVLWHDFRIFAEYLPALQQVAPSIKAHLIEKRCCNCAFKGETAEKCNEKLYNEFLLKLRGEEENGKN